MRTAQQGDQVRVHFVKRAPNGAMSSSRGRAPLEVTVGTDPLRLPGLGMALVGIGEGERIQVQVPAEQAYGARRAERLRRVARTRFPKGQAFSTDSWVRVTSRLGSRRLVRIVEISDESIVVDVSHPWAGQALTLDVELVAIRTAASASRVDAGSPKISSGG